MAYVSSKGYFVRKLRDEFGITSHEGKRIKQMKTYEVANLYKSKVNNI